MAVFNPSPGQTSDPNYLGWSKSITQPQGDMSAAYIGQGVKDLTTGIGLGIEGANSAMDKGIGDEARDIVNEKRNKYIEQLQMADSAVRGVTPADPMAPSTNVTPQGVQNLDQKIEALKNQRDQLNLKGNNHVSDVMFHMEVLNAAKTLRAQHPGYAATVDEKFKAALGQDPANAVVRSLQSDINSFLTAKNTEVDKIRSKIINDPYLATRDEKGNMISPGSDDMLKYGDRTGDWNKVFEWYVSRKGQENNWAARRSQLETAEAERKDTLPQAESLAAEIAHTMAANDFQNMEYKSGVKMVDVLKRVGTPGLSDQEGRQAGMVTENNALATENAIRAELFKTSSTGGPSLGSRLGTPKTEEIIKSAMSLHRGAASRFLDKDNGAAFMHYHMGSAASADFFSRMLGEPDLQAMLLTLNAVQRAGGQSVFSSALVNSLLESKLPAQVRDKLTVEKMKGYSQTDWFPRQNGVGSDVGPTPSNAPYSEHRLLDETDKATRGYPATVRQQAYKENAEDPVKIMLDPKIAPDMKLKTASMLFGPWSQGTTSRFTSNNGGPFKVFSMWTAPEMTNVIANLEAQQPGIFTQYKTWAETEFSSLYRQQMASTQQYLTRQKELGFKLQYNLNTNQLQAEFTPQGRTDKRDPQAVQRMVDREILRPLNMGLATMANIATKAGEKDIPVYLLKGLKQNGVDINQIQILSDSMKLNYAEDEQGNLKPKGPSVEEFFRNPTGAPKKEIRNYGDSIPGEPINIPEGVSPQQFIRQLKSEGKL